VFQKDGQMLDHAGTSFGSPKIKRLVIPKGFTHGEPTGFVDVQHFNILLPCLEIHAMGLLRIILSNNAHRALDP
jgi:hypothetical protein